MMRSLFSGVAGLKVHQTRMDVIGNNIANVNTTSYKSQSMVFSDLLYQTTQAASAANGETGRGGINARQIGLGAKTGAISTAITQQGSAQSTNNPWDVMITGESFFVVSNGSQNFFTRDGSFTVDGAGNLVMSSTGYTVMGWQVDPETGDILPDVVTALRVMSEENMTYPPESTTKAYMSGIVDKNDSATSSTAGRVVTLNFFDNLGYSYTAKFSIHNLLDNPGEYYVQLDDILDENGDSLCKVYNVSSINEIASFGASDTIDTTSIYTLLPSAVYTPPTGTATEGTYAMKYQPGDILDGYSSNALVNAAKSTKIDLAADAKVAAGGDVKVTGTIELTQKELEASPYNMLFSSETKVDAATGDKTTEYYYEAVIDVTTGGTTTQQSVKLYPPGSANYKEDDWTKALQKSFKDLDKCTVTSFNAAGGVEITFEQTFSSKSDKEITFNADGKYFVGDNITWQEAYGLTEDNGSTYEQLMVASDGRSQITQHFTYTGNRLVYDTENGKFSYIGSANNDSATLNFQQSASSRNGNTISLTHFTDIDIDFSISSNVNNGGTSTAGMTSGDRTTGMGNGRKVGEMTGVEIAQDGKITAYYDNNQSRLLGQIAVANFANAAGLSKQGDNLYSATANSGEFDGIGDDISAGDGYMTSGVLEMSNVDLSQEFTEMITTQRGFQANSRIITVSDTMLEELVNLKR